MPKLAKTVRRPLTRTLNAAAWFFIAMSGLMLGGAAIQVADSPTQTVSLFEAMDHGRTFEAIGLTYHGWEGAGRALLQLIVLAVAAALTVLPARSPGGLRRRRLGHLALVAWAMLWMGNLLYLAAAAPGIDTISQAAILSLCFAGTAARALTTARRTQAQPLPDVETEVEPLSPASIIADPSISEIPFADSPTPTGVAPAPAASVRRDRIACLRSGGCAIIERGRMIRTALRNRIPGARQRTIALAGRAQLLARHQGRRVFGSSQAAARSGAKFARRTANRVDHFLREQGVLARTETPSAPEQSS